MSKVKNSKCKISQLINALELFQKEHGDIQVVYTEPKNRDGFEYVDIVEKFTICQCKIGRKKMIVLSDCFDKK